MSNQQDERAARYTFMRTWLPEEWVPFEVLGFLYGIRKDDAALWGSFRSWSSRLRRPLKVLSPDQVHRHAFESYLQRSGLLPIKQAAARLGMTKDSFENVLTVIEASDPLVASMQSFSRQLISESLLRSFHERFPKLRNTTFSSQDSYCSAIHKELKKDFNIDVEDLRCITSKLLDDKPDYAYEFDCFTDEPIGLRYQVWLDFKKPINLRPEACSWNLYVEREKDLKGLVLGGDEPSIPSKVKAKIKERL